MVTVTTMTKMIGHNNGHGTVIAPGHSKTLVKTRLVTVVIARVMYLRIQAQ